MSTALLPEHLIEHREREESGEEQRCAPHRLGLLVRFAMSPTYFMPSAAVIAGRRLLIPSTTN